MAYWSYVLQINFPFDKYYPDWFTTQLISIKDDEELIEDIGTLSIASFNALQAWLQQINTVQAATFGELANMYYRNTHRKIEWLSD